MTVLGFTAVAPVASIDRRAVRRGLAALVAALIAANAAAFWVTGTSTTEVSVDDAVARFRAATPPTADAAAPSGEAPAAIAGADGTLLAEPARPTAQRSSGPTTSVVSLVPAEGEKAAGEASPARAAGPAGVYLYATKGYEEVSVLGGARHTYPDSTTVTYTPTDCGYVIRWDALQERWDEWDACTPGSRIAVNNFVGYRSFFGQVDEKEYRCTEPADFRPDTDEVGRTFTGRCSTGRAEAIVDGKVVAIETVTVEGQTVPAVRVRLDLTLTGPTAGTRVLESWYAVDSGLLLRRTSATEADSESALGQTHYSEHFTLELSSLTARR